MGALASSLSVLVLINLARRYRIFFSQIRQRDQHTFPVARVGGIAIVISFFLVVIAGLIALPDFFHFSSPGLFGIDRNLIGLALALIVLTVVNVIDDLRGLPVPIRLASQILAGLLVVWFGIHVPNISNPFGGVIHLGGFDWLVIVVWLVIISNAVNWVDGVNGLASGLGAISLAVLFFLSIRPGIQQSGNAYLAAAAFGATIGFLPFNLGRAKAFLGDTGSMFLGFIIGILAIISGGKIATAFLVLAIPFLDALVVFVSRLASGQSPFKADRRHLHHRFLALGMKEWQIVALLYTVSLLFGLIALNTRTIGKFWAIVLAVALMALLVLLYSIGGKKDPHGQKQ